MKSMTSHDNPYVSVDEQSITTLVMFVTIQISFSIAKNTRLDFIVI